MHAFADGLRQIRRSPGFFALAVALIGAGIGLNALIFTLVEAVYLRPLPVRDPSSLIQIFQVLPNLHSQPDFTRMDYDLIARNLNSTVAGVIGQATAAVALQQGSYPERVFVQGVAPDYFQFLGVSALRGRVLAPEDHNTAVLSYDCWVRSFGRDPSAIGRVVRIEGHSFYIVGVTPKGFNGSTLDNGPDIRVLFEDARDFLTIPGPAGAGFANTEVVARLRPGFTLAQAQQEVSAILNRRNEAQIAMLASNPAMGQYADEFRRSLTETRWQPQRIDHGVSWLREEFRTTLFSLLAGTGLLILMICSNVSGLLLARAAARRKETAIRIALGASRARIVRHWLTESLLLAALGAIAGLAIVWIGAPILESAIPPVRSVTEGLRQVSLDLHPDMRVFACCGLACGVTAVLSGLAPAWRASRNDPHESLRIIMSDKGQHRIQSLLCTAQFALCAVLLITAALFLRSLINLRAVDPGFDRDRVITFAIDPRTVGYTDRQAVIFERRLIESVKSIAGVSNVALSSRALMQGIGAGATVVMPGQRVDAGKEVNTSVLGVSPGYFGTLAIPLVAGRDFREDESTADHRGLQPVIVNEAFARRFLRGSNPVGAYFEIGAVFHKPTCVIIGEVRDSNYRSLREPPPPTFYPPDFGGDARNRRLRPFQINVQTRQDPKSIVDPVRRVVRSLDPAMPVYQTATLSEQIDRSLEPEKLTAEIATGFAMFSIGLSVLGLYGLLAQFVTARTREIGVRLALGATRVRVLSTAGKLLVPIVAVGGAIGAMGAAAVGTYIQSIVFGVKISDPVLIPLTLALLAFIAAGAAFIPILRAIRIDPATSLREE